MDLGFNAKKGINIGELHFAIGIVARRSDAECARSSPRHGLLGRFCNDERYVRAIG